MNNKDNPISEEQKEGTTVVAIKTEDGVVVGADKQTTGKRQLKSEKIYPIHPNGVISNAGLVMSIQDLVSQLEARVKEYRIRRGKDMTVEAFLSETTEKVRVNSPFSYPQYFTNMLVAGYDGNEDPLLAQVDYIGTVSRKTDYYTIGSGGSFALGYVSSEYHEGLSLEEAKSIIVQSLSIAAKEGPYTGIGIDVAVIDDSGVELDKDIDIREV